MNHMLKTAYYAGCEAALIDLGLKNDRGLVKQAGLSPALIGALGGGVGGAVIGGYVPYAFDVGNVSTPGPFGNPDGFTLRGALAGGLVGALGGGLAGKLLPAGGLRSDILDTVPGVLAGTLASGNYGF